ncbi:prepilin-type N-terminal cleavage/methylation domain-containing protein [Rhizobiaceae bacterium CRRU44]|uniref:Type II secretion system protein H n=2 Tax=Ferranicluibacter rubi TaxID=2715133 RepID=A0AA43ZE85_9HYPH|nr:prepilin-type N-terminal cleavage/methylation domain-containing protein [Ferranicluibacter rubi]
MPTSSANRRSFPGALRPVPRDRRGGFAMLEVVLALVVLGLLASLGLPLVRTQTGATALRSKAFEIVALLRMERNAAMTSGRPATVLIDVQAGRIRSARTTSEIALPATMALNLSPARSADIRFFPDGRATASELALSSGRDSIRIAISGPTAMIRIVGASVAAR